MTTETVTIQFNSRGADKVERDLAGIGHASRTTAAALSFMRSALVVVASVRVIQNFSQMTDKFIDMKNQLNILTGSMDDAANMLERLNQLASRSDAPLERAVSLYKDLALATGQLKLSNRDLLIATEALLASFKISGASAQEADKATRQFTMGMRTGSFTARQWRAILEGAPVLASAIAKEFGLAAGQLLEFSKNNPELLNSAKIMEILKKNADEFITTAGNMTPTVGDAFNKLNNDMIMFFGKLSTASGLGKQLSEVLGTIGDNLADITLAILALGAVVGFNILISQARVFLLTVLSIPKYIALIGVTLFNAARAMLFFNAATLRNPFFLLGAGVILAIVGAFLIFEDQLKRLIAPLQNIGVTFNGLQDSAVTVVALFVAAFKTIIKTWDQFPAALLNIGIRAVNGLADVVNRGVNAIVSAFNVLLEGVGLDPIAAVAVFNPLKERGAEAARAISDTFVSEFSEVKENLGTFFSEIKMPQLLDDDILDKLPQVSQAYGDLGDSADKAAKKTKEVKDNTEQVTDALRSLEGSVSPAIAAYNQMAAAAKTIADAEAKGVQSLISKEELLRRITREQVGVGNAATDYKEKLELLNKAMQDGHVNTREYANAARDLRIAFLEGETSLSAGIERTFLKAAKDSEDYASQFEQVWGNTISSLESAFTEFLETGKFDFKKFINSIVADVSKLAIRGVMGQLGGGLMGGGGGGGGGGLGGLFGGGGGGGGGIGSIFGSIGKLFGFADGGAFTVGAGTALGGQISGRDNRVVAFRARDGETVNVTPPGSAGGHGTTVVQNFNISTPDANSFRRSQSQVLQTANVAMERAVRRNG